MMVLVPNEAEEDPEKFFSDLGFGLRVEEHDLHGECKARGEPGRASFFVEGNDPYFTRGSTALLNMARIITGGSPTAAE